MVDVHIPVSSRKKPGFHGEAIEFRGRPASRARINYVGAALQEVVLEGVSIIEGSRSDYEQVNPQLAGWFNSFLLYPNRTEGGRSSAAPGLQLPLNEEMVDGRRNNLHGVPGAYMEVWSPETHHTYDANSYVRFTTEVNNKNAGEGTIFPYSLNLSVTYRFGEDGRLKINVTATNVGQDNAPFAAGLHTYLALRDGRGRLKPVDDLELKLPGRKVVVTDKGMIPTGAIERVERFENGRYDFGQRRPIEDTQFDHGFTGMEFDGDGWATTEIYDPKTKVTVLYRQDRSFPFGQNFSGEALPDKGRHRRVFAAEPMSSSADALNRGEEGGLLWIQPGQIWEGNLELMVKRG